MKWIVGIGAGILVAVGGVFGYQYLFGYEPRDAMLFINAYAEYEELLVAEEARVYVPGQGSNASRQELNELLHAILAEDGENMPPRARAASAQEALSQLALLKEEIDSAQSSHAAIYGAIDRVSSAREQLDSAQLRVQSERVLTLMRERQEATARITALQSATNDHAEEILLRVLAEEGRLSDALIIYINEGTSAAEARFDELTRLYEELGDIRKELEAEHGRFVALAL